MSKILKLIIILMLFCLVSAGSLALVYLLTQAKIETNAKLAFNLAVREVLSTGSGEAIKVALQGYAGSIEMLVGVNSSGEVIGIKILGQKETPGLGVNITKNIFLKQFIGKTITDKLEPKEDIDAITGATISSRAVCQGVKEAIMKVMNKP
jgi:electron transport complex protein RnfG